MKPTCHIADAVIGDGPADSPVESTLSALGAALKARDAGTHAHSQRLTSYALALGRLLGLPRTELLTLERGVFLHDIGKTYVSEGILRKSGPLSRTEWVEMRLHSAIGYGIASSIPGLRAAAPIVLAHHEWYDGTGYPRGLKGSDIPLGARICSVVDTVDALTSVRPYRFPLSMVKACDQVWSESGTHFDPLVVDAFLAIPPAEWEQLQSSITRRLRLPQPEQVLSVRGRSSRRACTAFRPTF
ncbi:MAG: HD domain-containing protein [Nitrospirae bacterium]|nr:MAG: HD domain-containing protein [Nitrospirota bacterium]